MSKSITVTVTYEPREALETPPLRYAVLPLVHGWVIYDRLTFQIINGVYFGLQSVCGVADYYNSGGKVHENMTPNASALHLIFGYDETKGE